MSPPSSRAHEGRGSVGQPEGLKVRPRAVRAGYSPRPRTAGAPHVALRPPRQGARSYHCCRIPPPSPEPRAAPAGAAASAAAAAARSAPAPRRSEALTPPSSSLPRALPPSFPRPCDRGRPLGRARPRSLPPPALSPPPPRPRATTPSRPRPPRASAVARSRARHARPHSRGHTHPAQACEPPLPLASRWHAPSPRGHTRPHWHAWPARNRPSSGTPSRRPWSPRFTRSPDRGSQKRARTHTHTHSAGSPRAAGRALNLPGVAHSHSLSHSASARSPLCTLPHVQAQAASHRLPGIPRANSRGPPAGISVRRRRARAPRPHFGQGRPAVSVPPVVLPPPAVTPPPSHRHSHPLSGGKGAICPRDPGWTRLGTKTLTSHQVSSDTPLLPCPSSPPPSAPDPRPRERPPPGLRGVGRVRPLCLDGQCQSARARVWRWRFAPRAFLFAAWASEGRVCSLHSPPGLRSGDNMGD